MFLKKTVKGFILNTMVSGGKLGGGALFKNECEGKNEKGKGKRASKTG